MDRGQQWKRMHHTDFTAQFKPSEYGQTWQDVTGNEDFSKTIDEEALSHSDLVASIKQHGVKEPIQVYNGYVVDGHHRVAAAIDADADIPFENASSELYEGQIPKDSEE